MIERMSTGLMATADQTMTQTVDAMERDFRKIRVGAASASLLDAVLVDHQGRRARLVEMANVTISEPRQILIRTWDPSSLRAIGTATINVRRASGPRLPREMRGCATTD